MKQDFFLIISKHRIYYKLQNLYFNLALVIQTIKVIGEFVTFDGRWNASSQVNFSNCSDNEEMLQNFTLYTGFTNFLAKDLIQDYDNFITKITIDRCRNPS